MKKHRWIPEAIYWANKPYIEGRYHMMPFIWNSRTGKINHIWEELLTGRAWGNFLGCWKNFVSDMSDNYMYAKWSIYVGLTLLMHFAIYFTTHFLPKKTVHTTDSGSLSSPESTHMPTLKQKCLHIPILPSIALGHSNHLLDAWTISSFLACICW